MTTKYRQAQRQKIAATKAGLGQAEHPKLWPRGFIAQSLSLGSCCSRQSESLGFSSCLLVASTWLKWPQCPVQCGFVQNSNLGSVFLMLALRDKLKVIKQTHTHRLTYIHSHSPTLSLTQSHSHTLTHIHTYALLNTHPHLKHNRNQVPCPYQHPGGPDPPCDAQHLLASFAHRFS